MWASIDGSRGLVALLGHDQLRCLVSEHVLDAGEVVFAEIVVGIEDRDLRVRPLLQNVFCEDLCLDPVAGLEAHGPGKVLRVVPLAGAGGEEELRHLLGIVILLHGGLGRRAQRVEDQEDLVALDQLADLLHGLRRRVAVIIGNPVDLAAVDAALVVDHLEIGFLGLADDAVGGRGTGIGLDIADPDLGVGDAGVVRLLRIRGRGRKQRQRRCRGKQGEFLVHENSLGFSLRFLLGWSRHVRNEEAPARGALIRRWRLSCRLRTPPRILSATSACGSCRWRCAAAHRRSAPVVGI
ncbi:hypothetical protein ACVWXN_009077 [Bradyrhizobium sp. i1.4.4]